FPSPTGCRQRTLGASFQAAIVSAEEPSRFGPSHCGQSAAWASAAHMRQASKLRSQIMNTSRIIPERYVSADVSRISITLLVRPFGKGFLGVVQEMMERGIAP